jgi:hypothetical protein
MFVFLNSLVMILVSFSVYVMVAHFCLFFGGMVNLYCITTSQNYDIISKQQKLIKE